MYGFLTQSVICKVPDQDTTNTKTEFMSLIPAPTIPTPRSGKEEIDVYHNMSNYTSDHYELFCHDPLSRLAIDASSCMKLSSLRKIYHFIT